MDISGNMLFNKKDFPNLTDENHQITSPATDKYNCIGWALGHDDRWYEPVEKYYWPNHLPRDYSVGTLVALFEHEGFSACDHGDQELGFEKVAIFADEHEYMHAALQLASGQWTSKMGAGEDIQHETLTDVIGPAFGQVVKFMKRERRPPDVTR